MTIESCDTHIAGSALSGKEKSDLQRKLQKQMDTLQAKLADEMRLKDLNGAPIGKQDKQALNKLMQNPDELAKMKDELFKTIKDQVEDGLETKVRQVADLVRVQDLFDKFTQNPLSGETLSSAGEVISNRLNSLVGRNSIDTRRRVLRNHFRNKIDDFEAVMGCENNATFKSIRDIKQGSDAERVLYKKVYEIKDQLDPDQLTPEKIKSLLAGKGELDRLAYSLVAYNEYTRKAMGKFGVSVKFNEQYVMKRNYDWAPMEKMGEAGWADFMADQLNLKQTFGDTVTREQAIIKLRDVYGEFRAKAMDRTSLLSGKDVVGDRANSKAVKFFYKDSDAAYNAFRDLSVGGMREQFERNAMSMAGTAIQISEFGYDSRAVTSQLNAKIRNAYPEKLNTMDQWRESRIIAAQTELSGQQHLVQGTLTNFSNNVRFMTAFTKLGTTLATTIADAVENNRQAFYVNGDFFGGLMDWTSTMMKTVSPKALGGMSKAEMTDFANTFGVILSHQSNAEGMRMATGDLATNGGAITRLIQEHGGTALNLATLLPSQTGYSKIASAMTAVNNFSKLIDDATAGKLNKFQRDTLNEYGLSKQEVALLGSGHIERTNAWGTRDIFTGANIRKLLEHKGGPEFIAQQLGVHPETAGRAVLELATKFESFVNDFTTRGTPTPELATKTLLFKNTENQGLRALVNLTTQFMDTPMAMAENFSDLVKKVKRVNTLDGQFSKMGASRDMLGHLGVYGAAGIPMYLAADAVMSAVTNSESMIQQAYNGDSEKRRQVFTKALGRVGLVPYLTELIDNQWGGGYNKTAMDTFIGPNWGTVRDTLRLMQPNDAGGMEMSEYLRRQGPANAIPVRGLNNWAKTMTGDKIWDDNKGTFL